LTLTVALTAGEHHRAAHRSRIRILRIFFILKI